LKLPSAPKLGAWQGRKRHALARTQASCEGGQRVHKGIKGGFGAVESQQKIARRETATLALALVLLAAAGAAGSASARSTSTRLEASTAQVPAVVRANDGANGRTVTIRRGQRLHVVLSSTYWQLLPSTKPTVLRLVGPPQISPKLSGCVPGGGCGTAAATYLAAAVGHATVSATRTSCGEALRCTGAAGQFRLNIIVR
jgi:hypothetical protein